MLFPLLSLQVEVCSGSLVDILQAVVSGTDGCLFSYGYAGLGKDYCWMTLNPNSDLSQTSHCNIKGLSVSEVMRIENMITQVKFY